MQLLVVGVFVQRSDLVVAFLGCVPVISSYDTGLECVEFY